MREVFDGFLCEYNDCVKELIDKDSPCAECVYCIDSILYAVAEAEAMLKESPYYIDGNGEVKEVILC